MNVFRLLAISAMLFSCTSFAQDLVLKNGHVRIMPPGQPNTAAFLTLENITDKDIILTHVMSAIAKKSEYHTHTKNQQGVMSMRQVMSVTINANSVFEFKSGTHHIMLMGLKRSLQPDQKVKLALRSKSGNDYEFELPAVSILNEQPKDHSHHQHMHH